MEHDTQKPTAIITENTIEVDIEDEIQDWSVLSKLKGTSLPKRGEKDYEPDGTSVQSQALQQSREAMFSALDGQRGHVVKQNVRAVWVQSLRKGRISKPKGSFLQTIGLIDREGTCWLSREEFVYLAERGTVEPWFENKDLAMDLQSVYAMCFVSEDELDEYHVYAHLKRHGYILARHTNDNLDEDRIKIQESFLTRLWNQVVKLRVFKILSGYLQKLNIVAYKPFNDLHFITSRYINYSQIYESIKLIPFQSTKNSDTAPLNITYNVWKPSPSFSKKSPPLPNFQVVVRNVNNYRFPTLSEINSLLERVDTLKVEQKPHKAPAIAQLNRLKHGSESIIMAIVDYGIVNFVKIAKGGFGKENMWHIPVEKSHARTKKIR